MYIFKWHFENFQNRTPGEVLQGRSKSKFNITLSRVARQSPGPLRPLTFLGVTRSLGLRESPGGLAKSRATEATDISRGHRVTGPSGKSRWPGKVPGPLRPLTFLGVTGSLGLWESPGGPAKSGPLRPLQFLGVTGSLGLRESPGGPVKSWATEAIDISRGHLVTGPSGKSWWPGKVLGH